MTRQRATILEIIRSAPHHRTADELFALAKQRLPGISLATVYNNLHALERDEMIRRITAEDGSDIYDPIRAPHGHLFCTVCHSITNFELPTFLQTLEKAAGSDIESYELKVRYVCPKCKAAADAQNALSDE